jgi:predicted phosphoadenosine phosphosulfate sulfurtransferase
LAEWETRNHEAPKEKRPTEVLSPEGGVRFRARRYIRYWKERGYEKGIPEEVPNLLMKKGLAPSYKALCFALLKNDMPLLSLGFPPAYSEWYGTFKRIELGIR